jgi:hypothetical protein
MKESKKRSSPIAPLPFFFLLARQKSPPTTRKKPCNRETGKNLGLRRLRIACLLHSC